MARSSAVIDYRGSFDFDVAPEVMWHSIEHAERFEGWWSWLAEFRLDGPGLVDGAVLHGVVSPPVPYAMRIRVVLDRCIAPSSIDATVHGDLEGDAHLVLEPTPRGTRAEVSWTVEMTQRAMRLAARVAHPVMRWGHDRVVEATVLSYRRHLADENAPDRTRRRP
ncbi:MAG TPA: hypothetical protein VII76_14565 [Acidimicrobiales bacterium]